MGDEIRAGTGRVDITPSVGSCLVGYLSPRISRGVRDPLFATSAVLGRGEDRVALVSCDLMAVPRPWSDVAKSMIMEETGIPPERVMIAATHIHTGPCVSSVFMSDADHEYLSTLPSAIARSVELADASATPASIQVGTAREDGLSFNRRFRMKDGTVSTNPGIGNPDAGPPAGPIDPEVIGLSIRDLDGRVRGCLFNYANHVDVMTGNLISSDYPGLLARLFRQSYGDDANLVYLNGACGNLNHIDISGRRNQNGPEQVEMIGRTLFDDLEKILGNSKPDPVSRLGGALEEIKLPRHRVTGEEIARAKEVLEKREGMDREVIFAREIMMLARNPSMEIGTVMQVLRVGEAAFLGIPGEVFVEIGLSIKETSGFPLTAVVELANDYVGYLPTDEGFEQGGYEVTPARSSQAAPGTARVLVDGAGKLISMLGR